MDRIPLYTNIENLAEVYSWERRSQNFINVNLMLKRESEIKFCETEDEAFANPLFVELAKDLTAGDLKFEYRDSQESFLHPQFKTNLQELFTNKSSVFWSKDKDRIEIAKPKNGLLLAGIGSELDVYNKLNFNKDIYSGNKLLSIGSSFTNYNSFVDFILPFNELIINEPYLFCPENNNYNLNNYLSHNFEELIKQLFSNTSNKVNIVICTTIHDRDKEKSDWWDSDVKNFDSLFNYCKDFLKEILGGKKFKLWFIVSPENRMARHDRYILTNYQFIDSPAGLTFFDDRGNFINRGESIHIYSLLHDDARKTHIPNVISNFQENVIAKIKTSSPDRIYGPICNDERIENSYLLKFNDR